MYKYSLVVFTLAALIQSGYAIVAIPNLHSCTNRPAWESCLSFGLTLSRGNSDTMLANASFRTHRLNPTNEVTLSIEGSYGENKSVENNETVHGYGQYNHLFIDDHVYSYARADGLHDAIADISYRATVSPGVGYYFIKSKETTLAGELGPGGVFEKLDGFTKYYAAPRLAERFDRKVDGHAHFWENVEFLPQVDENDNFLVNAEIGAEAPLTKKISLRTVFQDNFANVPAPGHEDNDIKLISGLVYKF